MKRLFLAFLLLALACPAQAQESVFVYSKTVLKIIPKPQSESASQGEPQPPGGIVTREDLLPKLKRAPKEFTVDIRPLSFLDQKDFIARQPFADREGLLILIDPPAVEQVNATRMIATADVLFVNEDGYIIKIAPRLKLTGLAEPVDSGSPIHALVFLKSGTTESSDIQLGDRIESRDFKTHPLVIQ